ncbi:HNH endonuclease signature motif containing protein [Homoserinimonas sp. A447]
MPTFVDTFTASVDAVLSATAELNEAAASAGQLPDETLLQSQRSLSSARRNLDAAAARLAGETAVRSSREAGLSGLAQKEGFRTPEALVRTLTGSTGREAVTLVRVGALLHDASVGDGTDTASGSATPVSDRPWLTAIGVEVAAGLLLVAGAEAIRAGLGVPDAGVSADQLAQAAAAIAAAALGLDVDELYRLARNARDDLDEAGIAAREKAQREQRCLRRWRKPDGMTRYIWELDPEGAAVVDGVYDQLTSPRRGGPRMVDETEQARAAAVEQDPRTTDQLASDGLLQLVTIAVGTDPSQIIGRAQPAVRVLVSADSLTDRSGHGRIESHPNPVSIETVERIACTSGTVPVIFDQHGQAIDVGREQRLFTRRQKVALAARDGGCRWPGCGRPPSWTEAHHVEHWKRDHGPTDLANGILLCRHHHLLLHDNHWEIYREGGNYWLTPPRTIDPAQAPRPMPHKSAALKDLLAGREQRRSA